MKKILSYLITALFAVMSTAAAHARSENVFELLDLNRKGLENVKKAYAKGNTKKASEELLKYFRTRTGVTLAGLDFSKVKNNEAEQKWADESLEHKFYAHRGYQSYFYGDDIDWKLWPVKDNELRWQLHRHYWFIPLANAYYVTKDSKYVSAWMEHYTDWVKKNPLAVGESKKGGTISSGEVSQEAVTDADLENARYAWRPLEVSRRLQDQLTSFALTIDAPEFTPEFLDMFLVMYRKHANHILNHYSEKGNHLLFEAQRMIYAGAYFPEFKDAEKWRKSGIDILNREIGVQVYDDGMQYELDPGYHRASINIFLKALDMAQLNGFEKEFPASYVQAIEKMIEVSYNIMYPDYMDPTFSDHKMNSKSSVKRDYRNWQHVFPANQQIAFFASEGRKGKQPAYTSNAFATSGYYILRDGWNPDATVMVVKAGPPAFWHNQPDNGTFELWRKGRNFFPDSGSYVYSGDVKVQQERDWFRQTRVHNTLTLDSRDLENTDSKLLFWGRDGKTDIFVTRNQSYANLAHTRTILFVEGDFYVIIDEADGDATGLVGVHFNMLPGEVTLDPAKMSAKTNFADGNNISVHTFAPEGAVQVVEEGWYSPAYRKKIERTSYAVQAEKATAGPLRFTTLIVPVCTNPAGEGSVVVLEEGDERKVEVKIGEKTYNVAYKLKYAQHKTM